MARSKLRVEVNPFFGFSVKAATAIRDDKSSQFNMICPGGIVHDDDDNPVDHAPSGVNMKFICPVCQNDDRSTFVQGKVQDDNTVLMFSSDAVKEAKATDEEPKTKLRISCHPAEQVDTRALFSGKAYHLVPEAANDKPYSLFVKLIEANSERAFLTTWAYRDVVKLYRLMVFDGVLTLAPLCWPEDLAETPKVPNEIIEDAELAQGQALIDLLVEDFDASDYRNVRREAIKAMVDSATGIEGAVVEATGKSKAPTQDLSGALAAALAAAQAAKGVTPAATGKVAKKAPAKKAVAAKK